MKKNMIALSVLCGLFTGAASAGSSASDAADTRVPAGYPAEMAESVYTRIDYDALVRGYVDMNPEAAFMALYNAYYNEGSTKQHVGMMETSVDPRQTVLTANAETLYAVHPVNLSDYDGAVVLEVPPMTLGMVNSPGWNIVGDLGLTGADKGQGGKYLITGPTFEGTVPAGLHHIKSDANTIVWLIRGFVEDNDWKGAVQHLQTLRTYPLTEMDNPAATTFYNTSESIVNNNKNMDMSWSPEDTFDLIRQYVKANRYTPHAEKHAYTIGHLSDANFWEGKIKGEEAAIIEGELRVKTIAFNNRNRTARKWGGDNRWEWANNVADENYTARSVSGFLPSQQLAWTHKATFTAAAMTRPEEGTGSQYIEANKDSDGRFLSGSDCYSLNITAGMPANNFWSVNTYNATERSMIVNDDFNWGANSYHKDLAYNEDGSVTLTFGPQSNDGNKNHIQTIKDEGFFAWFRAYSPSKPWYDNSWVLPNVERIQCK